MWFRFGTSPDSIFKAIQPNLVAMLNNAKYGIDISIKPHTRTRTNEQNRLLWEIYNHIVKFYDDTGFVIDGLRVNFLTADFLHEYFKARFGLKTTTKLSTKDFSEYIAKIQLAMIEQSKGEYEALYPEQNYLEKTGLIERE